MEYNLQKTVEPNLHQYLKINQPYPHLTSYPAHNLVVPGVGNVLSNPTFFVPLQQRQDPHLIKKSVDFSNNQEGLGTETSNNQLKEQDSSASLSSEIQNPPPEESQIEVNNRKRKLMDPIIFDAFSHPSFKSKTVVLNPTKEDKAGKGIRVKKEKPLEYHKFQFL
jgi:hypothetical protein